MRTFEIFAAFALVACGPTAVEPAEQQEVANGCPAAASSIWTADDGVGFTIEASAAGDDCDRATATIAIRKASGETVWIEAYPANQVMTLAGAESVGDMQRRLNEWINAPGAAPDSTGDLPEWAPSEDYPMNDEFPFHPEQRFGRAAYEALRARDAAMICYEQGMESVACLFENNGEIEKIGVQTFPR